MLLNASPSGVSAFPGALPDTAIAAADPGAAPLPVPVSVTMAEPLRGRALLARLEQVAQLELAQWAAGMGEAALPGTVDPALIGLAWDLGLSGDAVAQTTGHAARHPTR